MRFSVLAPFALACFLPLLALADADDNFSTDLSRLNYYPHARVFEWDPHITSTVSDHTSNNNGVGTSTSSNDIFLGANYGVSPGIRLALSETLLWDSVTDGRSTPAQSAGLSNPTATFAWRVLESGQLGLSGDLIARLTPSLGAKIPSNSTQNIVGNNLGGASTTAFEGVVYWRLGDNELGPSATAARSYTGQTHGFNASSTFPTDPFWTYTFGCADRFHFFPDFFAEASLNYVITDNSTHELSSGVNAYVRNQPFWESTFELGARLEPSYVLVASLTWETTAVTSINANGIGVITTEKKATAQLTLLHALSL